MRTLALFVASILCMLASVPVIFSGVALSDASPCAWAAVGAGFALLYMGGRMAAHADGLASC